jgi:hypothetical protein
MLRPKKRIGKASPASNRRMCRNGQISSRRNTVETKHEESMETSEKSDEVLTAGGFRVKALLIRCNFWRNSVSNIADVVEAVYTTPTEQQELR